MDREMEDLPSADGDAEKLMNEKDEVDDEVWERHKVKKTLGRMFIDDLKWFVETYTVALCIYLVLMILFIAIGCTKLNLTYEAWMAGFIIILQIGWLTADVSPPHFVLFASMALLMIWRVTTPAETITGFANTSVHTIGCVLVVTENLMRSGVMAYVARYMLGTPKFVTIGQIRLLYPVMCISGIVPDTPTVATFLPIVQKWIRQRGFSPSYFLMPLSFTALLGGTLTIIGTSTNLVVQGLIETYMLDIKIGFIDIATVGAPVAVAGVTYIVIFSQCCLPRKKDVLSDSLAKSREYTCAVRVAKGSPVEKMSIARSGLRHLDGLYLYEIERENGDILASPPPETILLGGDMLKFTGLVSSLAEVLRTDGLVSVEAEQVQKLTAPSHQRVLVEAIVSPNSWMVGRTPRSVEFRARFNSAIIAVARHGHRLNEKIGDIVFESADVLLLEAHSDFVENYKFDENFVLVSALDEGSVAPIRSKPVMIFSVLCLIIPIVSSITYQYCAWDAQAIGYTLYPTLLLSCCIIVILRFMTVGQALVAARLPILFTIAASFSLGTAVNNSGLGTEMANFLLPIFEHAGKFGVLLGLFVIVSLMNSFVSNAAAMTIMFPIAINFVDQGALELRPMIYVMMMAGSADFCTPVGYQTNLMVYGPGGYKFLHYTVFGFPLMLLDALITCTICYFL